VDGQSLELRHFSFPQSLLQELAACQNATASKNSMHTTLLHFRHFQRSLHWHCENTPQNSLNVQMGWKVSYVHVQQLKRFTILPYFSTIFSFPFGRILTKIERPLAKMIYAT
jgi:hypothetical protein